MNSENQRRSFVKLSLRDIIAIITLVSLSLALVLSRFELSALRADFDKLSIKPYIEVPFANPVDTIYSKRFAITAIGRFFPMGYVFKTNPSLSCKLIDSAGTEVYEASFPIDIDSGIFTLRISPDTELNGGLYAVKLTALDGDNRLAEQYQVIRITD